MSIKILIGGDFVPTESNLKYFSDGYMSDLIGKKLKSIIDGQDEFILNLEAPITNSVTAISKAGPNLSISPIIRKNLKMLNITGFSGANNHIMDYGEEGLYDTIRFLKEEGISFWGAGTTLNEAKKIHLINIKGKIVGIYSCAEHEFSISEEDKAGANPFDPLYSLDDILEAKKLCDYLIVLYHGGLEYYRYPSPILQKRCRRIIDKGADIVICQHSHCIGCKEIYNGKYICYGQGNFLFDSFSFENTFVTTSLLIELTIKNDFFSIEEIPLIKQNEKIRLAENEQKEGILSAYEARSNEILKKGFIESEFRRISKNLIKSKFKHLSGNPFLTRVIRKIFGIELNTFDFLNLSQLNYMRNMVECEAHQEVILKAIDQRSLELKKR